jgi:hypothetical protein
MWELEVFTGLVLKPFYASGFSVSTTQNVNMQGLDHHQPFTKAPHRMAENTRRAMLKTKNTPGHYSQVD